MVSVMAVSGYMQVASAFNPLCQTPIIANTEVMSTVTKKSHLVDTFFFLSSFCNYLCKCPPEIIAC